MKRTDQLKGDCILWERGTARGYGVAWIKRRPVRAHRKVMAEIYGWDAIEGKNVNHHCDVKACINPEHLYIGTSSDNQRDTWRRSRKPKLSPDDIREIKAAVNETQRQLAVRFGVSQSAISHAVRHR